MEDLLDELTLMVNRKNREDVRAFFRKKFGCAGSLLWCKGSAVEVCRFSFPEARRILVPEPGTEPVSTVLEGGLFIFIYS